MMIKVEVQYFTGCPNSQKMIDNAKTAIGQLNFEIEYTETLVESVESAKQTRFRGSPTLLINGFDFENLPEPNEPALSCRYYPSGIPTVDQIKIFLENSM
ncbi:MAG: DUF2703 domain-containing protein [Ignavibacteriaceae bacterium]|nr:DUF2703 domain-containing protein [Ignavibacteriaceae bacterium]